MGPTPGQTTRNNLGSLLSRELTALYPLSVSVVVSVEILQTQGSFEAPPPPGSQIGSLLSFHPPPNGHRILRLSL